MSRYSISLESSGDLIKDGFESESVAYLISMRTEPFYLMEESHHRQT
jgi:hypothetical protein